MSKPIAVGYARISDDREGLERGVDRQREDVEELAAKYGVEVERLYVDNDRGASTRSRAKRPEYEALIERVGQGGVSFILSYSNSRLTRRPMEFEGLIQLHERTKVRIATTVSGEDDLSTADGRMIARIKAGIDAGEAERTGERVARAHLQTAREGKPAGGRRAFGWLDDKITEHPVEGPLVREAAERILAGDSLLKVQLDWRDRNVLTSRGNLYHRTEIRNLLLSPRIAGWRMLRGEYVLVNGERVRGVWAPLVDQDTFDRVEAILASRNRQRRATREGARAYLLSGFLRCECNAPMYGGKWKETFYYKCSTGESGHSQVRGPAVDKMVKDMLWQYMQRDGVPGAEVAPDFTGAERLAEIGTSIEVLMSSFTSGRLSDAVVFPAVEKLEAERDDLNESRADWLIATSGPAFHSMSEDEWFKGTPDYCRPYVEKILDGFIVKRATKRGGRFDADRVKPFGWRTGRPALHVVRG